MFCDHSQSIHHVGDNIAAKVMFPHHPPNPRFGCRPPQIPKFGVQTPPRGVPTPPQGGSDPPQEGSRPPQPGPTTQGKPDFRFNFAISALKPRFLAKIPHSESRKPGNPQKIAIFRDFRGFFGVRNPPKSGLERAGD
jgi:hypothetical protein